MTKALSPGKSSETTLEELSEQAQQIYDKGMPQSSQAEIESQKKLDKLKKKAVKAIFDSPSTRYFNVKFLTTWIQSTYNSGQWNMREGENLWGYSEQAGLVSSAKLYLENGDAYSGSLLGGKRHGSGTQTEISGPITYFYNGEWKEDRKHG